MQTSKKLIVSSLFLSIGIMGIITAADLPQQPVSNEDIMTIIQSHNKKSSEIIANGGKGAIDIDTSRRLMQAASTEVTTELRKLLIRANPAQKQTILGFAIEDINPDLIAPTLSAGAKYQQNQFNRILEIIKTLESTKKLYTEKLLRARASKADDLPLVEYVFASIKDSLENALKIRDIYAQFFVPKNKRMNANFLTPSEAAATKFDASH